MASGKIRNFDLLSSYSYFVPGPLKLISLALFFMVGAALANVIYAVMLPFGAACSEMTMLVSYVVMFIPPMLYASLESRKGIFSDEGRLVDSAHFGGAGLLLTGLAVMAATISLSFIMDGISAALLPQMPDYLEELFRKMTGGNLLLNFLMVSILAPFFEEWLCRGMILRGLLYFRRSRPLGGGTDGGGGCGIRPVWAITISALFFALIHLNPWQALPAFSLGCLFGYVYYRTGSLKLTMLMHLTNNTMALIIGNIDSLDGADNWTDVLAPGPYLAASAICAAVLLLVIRMLRRIPLQSPQGNCDKISL